MKTKIVTTLVVGAAVAGVLWLKQRDRERDPSDPQAVETESETKGEPHAEVLLFADPREEDADCGCADIIRMARAAKDVRGVRYLEIDSRETTAESEKWKIRISPTLLILDETGKETHRFQGESESTVAQMKEALDALGQAGARKTMTK